MNHPKFNERDRRENGAALLVTMLVLVLVSMLAFAGMNHSEQESTAGARSRASARTIYAADAGVQLALSRLGQSPPNLLAFDVNLSDGANVQSRTRTDLVPLDLDQVGIGSDPGEGYGLNVGAAVVKVARVYLVNTTATAGGSTAEVEAKLSRTGATSGGY